MGVEAAGVEAAGAEALAGTVTMLTVAELVETLVAEEVETGVGGRGAYDSAVGRVDNNCTANDDWGGGVREETYAEVLPVILVVLLVVPFVPLGVARLEQHKFISNRSIISKNKLPLEGGSVEDGELTETVVFRIKDSGDVQNTPAQFTVAFNVSSHAVDDMRHRHASVGIVGVVVDDRGCVNSAVHREREQTLVLVNMTKMKKKKVSG